MKNALAERILSRGERVKPEVALPVNPVTPSPRLHLPKLEQPKNHPNTLTLAEQAAAILADLRPVETLTPSQWLELAEAARLEVVATFPPDRQHNALTTHIANHCGGQPAELIAAHTVAFKLWARHRPGVPIGHCQDAACEALGLEPDSLELGRVIPKRGSR